MKDKLPVSMIDQDLRRKVIRGLECCMISGEGGCDDCPYIGKGMCQELLGEHALALLKAQEPATAEPKRIELADETKAWLDKMDAVDALDNIADICIDWDGYRTADGLGGLVNEIWAYARYCADRIAKTQEPRAHRRWGENGECSVCGFQPWYERDIHTLTYCPNCGTKNVEG